MSSPLFKRSDDAIFADVGNDVVALHLQRGRCYGMENVSAAVWSLLAEPIHLEAICARLVERYDVDAERCRIEVAALLEQFHKEGLIEPVAA